MNILLVIIFLLSVLQVIYGLQSILLNPAYALGSGILTLLIINIAFYLLKFEQKIKISKNGLINISTYNSLSKNIALIILWVLAIIIFGSSWMLISSGHHGRGEGLTFIPGIILALFAYSIIRKRK